MKKIHCYIYSGIFLLLLSACSPEKKEQPENLPNILFIIPVLYLMPLFTGDLITSLERPAVLVPTGSMHISRGTVYQCLLRIY